MSKITVFDLDNYSMGDFQAMCDRGYAVLGSSSVSGGGSTTITVEKDVLSKGWLMPGRLVLVEDSRLEPWVGMVDMPIGLIAPAQVTLYNVEYLLSLRAPDNTDKLTGDIAKIVKGMIDLANQQEEMYLRIGEEGGGSTYREEQLDQRTFWEQINAAVIRADAELVFRAERNRDDGNRLYVYVDILDRAGKETDFLLHDGEDGNVSVLSATMDRAIWNRVTGINGASAASERLVTAAKIDSDSVNVFRLRSKVEQFRSTKLQSTLDQQTKTFLTENSMPVIKFNVLIKDNGDTFKNIQRGNGVILHSSRVNLPDGRRGWRGTARVMSYAYNEKQNSIGATLEARYEFV